MPINTRDTYKAEEFSKVYRHALRTGDIGICRWNIDKGKIYISEKITGYELDSFKDFKEYLSKIAYYKDKDLALQDLEDYFNRNTIYYHSTFRVETRAGQIKWVLLKGKIFKEKGDKVLNVIMFNVTGSKLHEGHDVLTNLINDKILFRKLESSIKIAKSQNKKGALIYIDIGNFKILVNNFGIQFGYELLQNFSQCLNSLIGEYDELAKLPSDKFVILIRSFNDIKEIQDMCKKIHEYFERPVNIMDIQINISLSIGVAIFPDDSPDVDELLKFCDFAVSQSKYLGKNICTFFDKEISESYFRKNLIVSELPNGLVNNEFYLHYQPKFDISANKFNSYEALLRWNNSKIGFVPPNEFIPIAENKGYIIEIGKWVMEEAIKTAASWNKKGYKFETISINICPVQLKRKDFIFYLLGLCLKHKISPCQVEIEITEGTLMETCRDNIEIIDNLIKSGFKIAIDDFGIGYSNLSSILKFPISTLKVDKSIIDNIENEVNKVLFKSIVNIANHLGFKVIAEGVETKEQFDILAQLGCNGIQGYYFSRPLPKDEIENILKKSF